MVYKTVSPAESQVGKYIDINGDGIPEGIIFADLAVGGEGQWGNEDFKEKYKIPTIEDGLKDYIVIDEYNDQINGKQEVLAPILDGNDRFYVMALNDINEDFHYWYYSARKTKDLILLQKDFGHGKENTVTLFNKWCDEKYGKQDHGDLWNHIRDEIKNGWFIPSLQEWCAFAEQLKVTDENFQEKGFMGFYWASSVTTTYNLVIPSEKLADKIDFEHNTTGAASFDYIYPIRLATTY